MHTYEISSGIFFSHLFSSYKSKCQSGETEKITSSINSETLLILRKVKYE